MTKDTKKTDALIYHSEPIPGKIAIVPTKRYASQRDLALAYSPGVAEPCLEIEKNIDDVYKYTNKGNLVAIVSNGTAVLGLGDIGPEASKPVMEGKGLLFKIFADIDGIDIELDTKDVDKFVETVKIMAPTFGGINLEDIKSPEAFEIERRLKEELDIPVMHDDQHGTAIISCAALVNAVDIVGKRIEEVKIVISGAGAAAISCSKLYKSFGARGENMVMIDSRGVIRKDRESLSKEKLEFATDRKIDTLEDAMKDADVFIGLSVANIMSSEMLSSMAKDPIVFAMSNPDPEIAYDLAMKTRDDVMMATGRSDLPNQVNNVLGFPFIFRGALDVRAKGINEEMKIAAVKAISELAKEPVPEQVQRAYKKTDMSFGRDYIIPKPFDQRLISTIPPAVAKAAMDTGIARESIIDWEAYKMQLEERIGTDNKMIRLIHDRAKTTPKKIVYTEADQIDVLKAAKIAYEEGICIPVLLGHEELVSTLMRKINFNAPIEIIHPNSEKNKQQRDEYAKVLYKHRCRNGITMNEADRLIKQRMYFGSMMLETGDVDGLVTGYTRGYAKSLETIFNVFEKEKGVRKVASTNLMLTKKGPLFFADTAVNVDPTAEELVSITEMTNKVVKLFGEKPVVAMLSHSNFGSSKHASAKKVKTAVKILQEKHKSLIIDGEVQPDFALNRDMLTKNFEHSKLKGRKVNTLIFPNLDSSNIAYKMLKEVHRVESIGPILMGVNKPVYVVQLGASVEEMVNMTAIAVIHAQQKTK